MPAYPFSRMTTIALDASSIASAKSANGDNAGIAMRSTERVALAAAGDGVATADVTAPAGIVLTSVGPDIAVTATDTVHIPFAGTEPPVSASDVPEGSAITVPPHVEDAAGLV